MPKLIMINNSQYLPIRKFEKDHIFNVFKEDESYYLVEMPPRSGGHVSETKTPAWWVNKSVCTSGTKKGQRWLYNIPELQKKCIVSFLDNDLAIVVQVIEGNFYVGEHLPCYASDTSATEWMYLEGQDTP